METHVKMDETGELTHLPLPKSAQKDDFALRVLIIAFDLERSFFFTVHFPFPLLLSPEVNSVSHGHNELEVWF